MCGRKMLSLVSVLLWLEGSNSTTFLFIGSILPTELEQEEQTEATQVPFLLCLSALDAAKKKPCPRVLNRLASVPARRS